jgi:hypothetical protein
MPGTDDTHTRPDAANRCHRRAAVTAEIPSAEANRAKLALGFTCNASNNARSTSST